MVVRFTLRRIDRQPGTKWRDDLVQARDRLGLRYQWGHVSEADYLAEYADLTSRIDALDELPDLPIGRGTIEILPDHPDGWEMEPELSRWLFRLLWSEIQVDVRKGKLAPVRAVWRYPDRR